MAVTINASTSTGLVQTADTSGVLQLQTAGTNAVTVDSSQKVGIGTDSPSAKLNVVGSFGLLNRSLLVTPSSESAAIDALRTVAIQRVSNDTQLAIGYATTPDAWVISSSYGSTGAYKPLAFATSDTERMRIDSSGRVIIGSTTSNDTTRLGVVSSTSGVNTNTSAITSTSGTRYHWTFQDGSSSTERGSITTNGSATAYNTTSDYRLKENILPMTGALATVQALKPVTYTWKESGDNSQGFIAHELQEVVPDAVTGEKDAVETYTDEDGNEQTKPKYQSIDTSFLVATLTAAIQEQQTIINDLKARVTALEAK